MSLPFKFAVETAEGAPSPYTARGCPSGSLGNRFAISRSPPFPITATKKGTAGAVPLKLVKKYVSFFSAFEDDNIFIFSIA